MPREIQSNAPGSLVTASYEDGPLLPGEIRVRADYAAPKHGTETHGWSDAADKAPVYYDARSHCFLPQTPEMVERGKGRVFRPGNMWVGRVVEVGEGVREYRVGDRLAGYGPLRQTHTQTVHAANQAGVGTSADLMRVPEEMPWQSAVLFDPCQFALSGVRDSNLRLGDTCCVMGLGAIGLMAAQMARLQGARFVVVSDPIEKRRALALKHGADFALDPASQDVGLELKKLTGNTGADVVIETSGAYPALQSALRGVAYGGRISVVGWYKACVGGFDLGLEAHMNNATLFFSRACSEPNPDHPRWNWDRINRECWHMLSTGMLKSEGVIDPVVPFGQAADTYLDVVVRHPEKSVKMGVEF